MKKRWLALTLALLTLVSAAALAEIAVPQPDSDLFYVYDGANVLSLETEAQIYYNNVNLYNACGAELVFVVVDDTNGYDLGAYSEAIFDAWELYDRDVLTVLFETPLEGEERERCEQQLAAIFKAKIGCTPEAKGVPMGELPRSEKKSKRIFDSRY